jgi:tetratricopeptide (TPR) repeat protein
VKAVVVLLLLCSAVSSAQSSAAAQDVSASRLAQLAEEKRWTEIVRLAESAPSPSADLQYYYGLAVFQMEAQLGNFQHAEEVLLAGHNSYPRDKRFPTELAGIAFRQKKYSQARRWLRHALKIDSRDAYANDFLATTYFLEGNVDAALNYWNRIDKPHIAEIRYEPQPTLDPILLDRAFAFSPESTLRLDELWTTEARLRALGIFPSTTIELAPRADGQFDTLFRSVERNGFGDGKLQSTLSFFRGVLQQTVYPEYRNANSSAINFTSLYRWDAQRRRVFASLSAPLRHDATWRYNFNVDLRNENWDIRNSPADTAPVLGAFNLRKATVSAGIGSLPNWRWGWSTGVELTHRDFRSGVTGPALTVATIPDGTQLAHLLQLNYELLRSPEHRVTISSDLQAHTGRVLSGPENLFSKLQAHAKLRWLPQPRGDDYEMVTHVTVARGFGDVPFDEMSPLGLDPDTDLFLRAHSVTRDGRKGNSPLSSSYFLSNSEFSKIAYSNGLFSLKVGPFVDIAKIMNASYTYEGNKWLCDTGLQLRLSALGVGFTFSYGKDLRSGNNLFYFSAR